MKSKRWQRSLSLTLAAVMVLATAVFVGSLAISAGLGKAAAAPACASTHVVQRGETLSIIAQRYGVGLSELAQANTLRNYDFIYVGQTLCLPPAGPSFTEGEGCPDCSQDFVAPPESQLVSARALAKGATYITNEDNEDNAHSGNPDGDMWPPAECVYRLDPPAPIEFNIDVTGPLPTNDATLALYVWDVDEEGVPDDPTWPPEVDEVYFNGTLVGTLTGANQTWSTSVFPLDIGLVHSGNNLVEIQIDTLGDNWCVGVDWGQLLIDSGASVKAAITSMTTADCYEVAAAVDISVDFVIDVTEAGNFRLETNLVDPNNITLDVDVYDFSTTGPETVNHTAHFTLHSADALGTYTVNAGLFDTDSGLLQSVKLATFEYAAACAPPPGTICVEGHKVDDKHRGVPGFVINAQMEGFSKVLQAVTDAKGYFRFDNLAPGLWTFWEEVPRGWEPVTASKFQKELEYGHSGCYQIRFKNKQVPIPACLIVSKQDEANNPLEGWEIHIKPKYGGSWLSEITDRSGQVRFDDLKPGKWLVKELLPYPWEAVDPKTGDTEIELQPMAHDDDCGELIFKNRRKPTGCVEGYKVDDQHGPLEGWEVCTYLSSAPAIEFCTKTDATGYFRFDNLIFSEWIVWEKVQPGWTPVTAEKFPVMVKDAQVCEQVRFKNRPPDLCAQGYKLDDKGFGLGGWTIKAWPENNPSLVLETLSEPNGHYRICGVTLGKWIFEEERKLGWTALAGERIEVDVTYPGPGKDVPAPIFRNAPPTGCIEGWKIDDKQVGLPLWNITIKNVATGQTWHDWTDGTGFFQFCGLPMGDYLVWEEQQTGWQPISPPQVPVTLTPSDQPIIAIVVFINKQVERDICIDGYKKDIYDGAGLPNWEVKLLDLKGHVLATTTTDGTGYYRFSNLDAGTYVVEETVQKGWWPASATSVKATVTFPPKFECVHVNFANRQKTTPPPPPPCCVTWHVVQKCETLSSIALRYGVSVSAIMAANNLTDPNFIWVGQKLCIPDP